MDLFWVCLSSVLVFYLRFGNNPQLPKDFGAGKYAGLLILYAALVGIFCQNQGLYRPMRILGPLDESFAVLRAVFFATLFLTTVIYLSGEKSVSRLVVGGAAALTAVTLPSWRFWKREIDRRRVTSGQEGKNVLIVGAGDVGQALARFFNENKYLGYVVKGFLDSAHDGDERIVGDLSDFPRTAMTHFIDEIFIACPSDKDLVDEIVVEARRRRIAVNIVPEMFDGLGWWAPVCYIGGFPVMQLMREPIPAFGLFVKRVVDVVGSALGLVALSPALAFLALIIYSDSPGPVIYRSWRVGRKGREFICYKLRTMVINADELKDKLRHMNERQGPLFKIANDPRLTRIGRFLRRYSLDEFPQLWNVLKGDMSLVGPRPPVPEERAEYRPEDLRRLDVKPGITGLWQVYGRQDPTFERALSLDLEYIENWSLWLDSKILLKTLLSVIAGSGR